MYCCDLKQKAAVKLPYRPMAKVPRDVSFGPVLNVLWISALKKFIGIKKAFL